MYGSFQISRKSEQKNTYRLENQHFTISKTKLDFVTAWFSICYIINYTQFIQWTNITHWKIGSYQLERLGRGITHAHAYTRIYTRLTLFCFVCENKTNTTTKHFIKGVESHPTGESQYRRFVTIVVLLYHILLNINNIRFNKERVLIKVTL